MSTTNEPALSVPSDAEGVASDCEGFAGACGAEGPGDGAFMVRAVSGVGSEEITHGLRSTLRKAAALIRDLHARAVQAEAKAGHYLAKTSASLGFTHEPTGRRITVYAADKTTLDALLYTPGIVEALREIHDAPKSVWGDGAPRSGVPKADARDVLAKIKGADHGR